MTMSSLATVIAGGYDVVIGKWVVIGLIGVVIALIVRARGKGNDDKKD